MANNNPSEKDVKISKNGISDFSQYDADFILKYADDKTDILDLGSGSGLIINKIYKNVKKVVAVEAFANFSKYIIKTPNIEVINQNIFDFDTTEQFDLITIFGVLQYFDENEAQAIYEKYLPYLKDSGKIIIKNQFGIFEDVTIDGFSEELQKDYFAQYRYYKNEMALLEKVGYKNPEIFDIYPPECNRWQNTHFYAIVASK